MIYFYLAITNIEIFGKAELIEEGEIHPEPIAETTSIEHFETVLFHVCFPQQFVLCIAVTGVNDIKFCILIWIIVIFPFKNLLWLLTA